MHKCFFLAVLSLVTLAASPAFAVTVRDCDGLTDRTANLVEPWEKNSRTFYNGKLRVALLDTGGEPACCSVHLLVQFFDEGEDGPGSVLCYQVEDQDGRGFAGIDFSSLTSAYDPARGLLLRFSYSAFPEDGDGSHTVPGQGAVRVNLATGTVTPE